MATVTKHQCPECREHAVVRVVYGFPSASMFDAAERGEIVLGGCMISEDAPRHPVTCTACRWTGQITDDGSFAPTTIGPWGV